MALALLGLGGVLGAVGQGARVIVGLKKDWEAASKDPRTKELADREEELHQAIQGLVAKEKDADRRIVDAQGRPAAANDKSEDKKKTVDDLIDAKARISKEKEVLLSEKAMVLGQRNERHWFSASELLVSLLIAVVIGAIAGVLSGMSLVEEETGIDRKTMLTIAGAGYAGTDFIEGFMKSNFPGK